MMGGGEQTISQTPPVALGSIRFQTSVYGLVLPILFGRNRVPGNIGWYGDFRAVATTTRTESSGGKGGGGGVTQETTTYSYEASVAIMLCEGPIRDVGKVWQDKAETTLGPLRMGVMGGDDPQGVWEHLAVHHPDQALRYPGVAFVAASAYQLTDQAGLPNHTFDVLGPLNYSSTIDDANPRDIVTQYLTHARYGAGFPAALLGDLTLYSTYCVANGFFLSPYLKEQRPANEQLAHWAEITNSEWVWSGGQLRLVPYGEEAVSGNGVTYFPDLTPQYDLGLGDFFPDDDEDPVSFERTSPADADNRLTLEYLDRANAYNTVAATAEDAAAVETFGPREASTIKADEITSAETARKVVQLLLQRRLYRRVKYRFRLSWRHARLEPMDYVTLTEPTLGLDRQLVQIDTIEEDDEGFLDVTADEVPLGAATAARNGQQTPGGYVADYNVDPGAPNEPIFFEAPADLAEGGLEIWLGVSGGALWGGCEVWISEDGEHYRQAGKIAAPARTGRLTAALAAGAAVDQVNTLGVTLAESRASLLSGTRDDADRLHTLCFVDGEFLAYETATLTGPNAYTLSYLVRGAHGSPIGAHKSGSRFCRVDGALFRYPFTVDAIGRTLFVKLPGFNVWGGGRQSLGEVGAYAVPITGAAISAPLDDVENVVTVYVAGLTEIHWDPVDDFREAYFGLDYEVRKGATPTSAQVLGRTPLTKFVADGDGQYWIAAHVSPRAGLNVYSGAWSSIVVEGSALVKNVIATRDEHATGWTGTRVELFVTGDDLVLGGAGDILDVADVLALNDVYWYGGVVAEGSYTLPAAHRVDGGRVAPCGVSFAYAVRAQNVFDDVLALVDVLGVEDLLGTELAPFVDAIAQINTAGDDGVWIGWRDYVPGTYLARHFDARLIVRSAAPQVTAFVTAFVFAVDVPDRIDAFDVATSAAALVAVVYSAPFKGGNGTASRPVVQCTILDALAGDDVVLTNETLAGFEIEVRNAGARVVRTVHVTAQGW